MLFHERPDGTRVESFSFSQGNNHRFCPTKYILERHFGWTQKLGSANMLYGNCIEFAVRAYHQTGASPKESFLERWGEIKDKEDKFEWKDWQTWETLAQCGQNHMILYSLLAGRLGIVNPAFYTYSAPLKGTLSSGAEHRYIPDAIDWPLPHPKWGSGARVIDIKTSDSPYRELPEGIAGLDEQLRFYSHQTQIERVAFLVFVKMNPGKAKAPSAGDVFTLMDDTGQFRLGDTVKVSNGGLKGKDLERFKALLDAQGMAAVVPLGQDVVPAPVPKKILCPVRIQLIEARVDPDQAASTYRWLSRESVAVEGSWKEFEGLAAEIKGWASSMTSEEYDKAMFKAAITAFPQRPGMKFPDDKCSWCSMLGLCLDRKDLVEERIVRIQDAFLEEI